MIEPRKAPPGPTANVDSYYAQQELDTSSPAYQAANKTNSASTPFIEDKSGVLVQDSSASSPRAILPSSIGKIRRWGPFMWMWEIICSAIALIIMVGIIVTLRVVDGEDVRDWNLPWTVPSFIAFLTTVMKGAMMVPITGCLGQLKFHHFRKISNLHDMELLDGGSRGSIGALKQLLHPHLWNLAAVGALITILSISQDTLVQNSLKVVGGRTPSTQIGTIPRTNNYDTVSTFDYGFASADMISAINIGMFLQSGFGDVSTQLPYYCPTGNCTWGTYQSLGVKAQCADVSDKIVQVANGWAHPSGPTLDRKGAVNSTAFFTYPTLNVFTNLGPLILRLSVLASGNPGVDTPTAVECVVYWIVYQMTARVTNENDTSLNPSLTETVEVTYTNKSDSGRTRYNQTNDIIIRPSDCWVNGTKVVNDMHGNCLHWVNARSQLGLQNFFANSKVGITGWGWRDGVGDWGFTSLFAHALIAQTYQKSSLGILYGIGNTTSSIANQLSMTVRQYPYNRTANEYRPAAGSTYNWVSIYQFRWKYIIFPAVLVIGSIFFLILTLVVTRKESPWKTSALALIFHGLTPEHRSHFDAATNIVDMKEQSKSAKVNLENTDLGWLLMSHGRPVRPVQP